MDTGIGTRWHRVNVSQVVDIVLFAVASAAPIVSNGRAPLPDIVVVRVVNCTVVVNGSQASEPLAVAVVVAEFFFGEWVLLDIGYLLSINPKP